ncbi:MAG: hypothetical protein ABEL76_08475, partial [Bradymonadaceae bacterium]
MSASYGRAEAGETADAAGLGETWTAPNLTLSRSSDTVMAHADALRSVELLQSTGVVRWSPR